MFINLDEGREGDSIGVKPRDSTHADTALSLVWVRKGRKGSAAPLSNPACLPGGKWTRI